jgi:CheY-like chemotaxis protein
MLTRIRERGGSASASAALHATFGAGGAGPAGSERGLELLVAEDDFDVREWLCLELEERIADIVVEAADGLELAERLRERRFDLVITDVQMPVASGLEVAEQARRQGVETPFLFITGVVTEKLRARVRRLGRAALLAKPMTIEELERAAQRLLLGREQ